ncbi:translation initiation factor eIF-1A [Candidatus Pacearchaeota archaeon]|nr:translation initiation factor eIF-1A [Candidatus Pacearchaeota archaeon]
MENPNNQFQKVRVKLPRQGEFLGMIDQRVGGSRMIVKCSDGKTRNCRVPGRLKRGLWIREGDIVIVKPWEFDDEKGDLLFKYNPSEAQFLRERGYLQGIENQI